MLNKAFTLTANKAKTAIACAFLSFSFLGPAMAETDIAIRANDFLNGLGVNTHTIYTDSQYADTGQTIAAMKYMGLRLIRDVSPNPSNAGQWTYGALAQGGLVMDLFVGGDAPGGSQNPATAVASIAALAKSYPGAVHAVEGPNEVNNGSVTYAGLTGIAGAQAYQAALYANVRAQPLLSSIPVYNFTDYPDASGKADYANFHSYPNTQLSCTGGNLTSNMNSQLAVMKGYGVVNTELGAYTKPLLLPGAMDQTSQARYLLQCALDNSAAGVKETYFYQLFDGYNDPLGLNDQDHYGLFDYSYAPKLAATAIRNSVRILTENWAGVNETTFTPGSLTYTATGATVKTKLMQFGSRWWILAVWNEAAVYNQVTGALNPTVSTTIAFPTKHQQIWVNDAITGTYYEVQNAASITYKQTGDPIFLSISPN